MSSINTNVAAMTALQSLTATNKALTETQNRISTGFRVADASDNAAYWSIATTMRSDNAALSTVQDALGLGAATVDVAYTGITAPSRSSTRSRASWLLPASPASIAARSRAKSPSCRRSCRASPSSASFSGENWLSVDSSAATYNATKSIVVVVLAYGRRGVDRHHRDRCRRHQAVRRRRPVGHPRRRPSTTTNGGVDYSVAGSTDALDISALTDSDDDLADLEQIIGAVDAAISSMTDSATALGAAKARIGIQQDFVKGLMDAIDRGVGQLVDADMNEESTKLQALQVKQQLGIQALSIANSSSQTILSLFR